MVGETPARAVGTNVTVGFCLGVAGVILVEAYQRLRTPRAVQGGPMLAIAVAGLAVNLVAVWMLRRDAGDSLNVRAAYLEVLSDAISSLGVIVAAVVVLLSGVTIVDGSPTVQ